MALKCGYWISNNWFED